MGSGCGGRGGVVGMVKLNCVKLPATLVVTSRNIRMVNASCGGRLITALGTNRAAFGRSKLSRLFGSTLGTNVGFSARCRGASVCVISIPAPCSGFSGGMSTYCIMTTVGRIVGIYPGNTVIIMRSAIDPNAVSGCVHPIMRTGKFGVKRSVGLIRTPRHVVPNGVMCRLVRGGHAVNTSSGRVNRGMGRCCTSFYRNRVIIASVHSTRVSGMIRGAFHTMGVTFTGRLSHVYHRSRVSICRVVGVYGVRPHMGVLRPNPNMNKRYVSISP